MINTIEKNRTVSGSASKLSLLIVILLLTLASPVYAAVEGFVARGIDGNYHQYSYNEMLDSYALKLLGKSNGLFEDYTAKKPVAIIDSVSGYIDYDYVLDQYALALLSGRKFDIDQTIQSSSAKKALIPDQLMVVSVADKQIVRVAKNLDQALLSSPPAVAIAPQPANDPASPLLVQVVSNPDKNGEVKLESPLKRTLLIAKPAVSLERAQKWAAGRGADQRFINIAPLYWEYAQETGLNPEILYAQSACETNFGRYTGAVPPEFNNWAGIKIASPNGDKPEDHEQFSTPEDGVRAHFNHMAAYTGLDPIGEPHGRYYVVLKLSWAGKVTALEELSGRWAPSPLYHETILKYLAEMK